MNETIYHIPCQVRQLDYLLPSLPCGGCGQEAPRVNIARRTAIDIDLDRPTLLSVRVSVHYCVTCHAYRRAQPPFLRPDAIYTQRVVRKAVEAVVHDGLAFRLVGQRLARDFCVQPSEAMIRRWCRRHSAALSSEAYTQWVVAEFSGLLCIDEVYQHTLALLLAVDPAAPEGDRLVGYQVVQDGVTAADVRTFLTRLAAGGIQPAEVITDGSPLYPTVIAEVWPQAAHQLCLFHETRRLTKAVSEVIRRVRRSLPLPPPDGGRFGQRGRPRKRPLSENPQDPAVQRWAARQEARRQGIAHVHTLAAQGLSQRAIARQAGLSRRVVRQWVETEVPPETFLPGADAAPSAPRRPRARCTPRLLAQIQDLAAQGCSFVTIARQTGVHRVTVSAWLREAPPLSTPSDTAVVSLLEQPLVLAPPAPWTSWEEVRAVREALKEHRGLLLRRPDHLSTEQRGLVETLLGGPVGPALTRARTFLTDWYALWRDEAGDKRPSEEALTRYTIWQGQIYDDELAPLQRAQEQITSERFARLSQFLRHPQWEATNNGAERTARLFRHQQGPHYAIRTVDTLQGVLDARLHERRNRTHQPAPPVALCPRGRRKPVSLDLAA